MATSANPVLFADDTSMNITKPDLTEFTNSINENSLKLNRWFKSSSLSLNFDKTRFLQFFTKLIKTMISNPIMITDKLQNLRLKTFLEFHWTLNYHRDNILKT
jgi:hypothetical protein